MSLLALSAGLMQSLWALDPVIPPTPPENAGIADSSSRSVSAGSGSNPAPKELRVNSSPFLTHPLPPEKKIAKEPNPYVLGLRVLDGWDGIRLGAGDKVDSGWLVVLGVGRRSDLISAHSDTEYTTRETNEGWLFKIADELYFAGPRGSAGYASLGIGYEWIKSETSSTSVRHQSNFPYDPIPGKKDVSGSTRRDKSWLAILGFGSRYRFTPNFAMVGGLEFDAAWTTGMVSFPGKESTIETTRFELRDPTWNLGVDWYF